MLGPWFMQSECGPTDESGCWWGITLLKVSWELRLDNLVVQCRANLGG